MMNKSIENGIGLPLPVTEQENCRICDQQAHGNHYGVMSCRACAAFFRRTVVQKRKYTCDRPDGSCEMSKGKRAVCCQCRFRKCVALGMTVDNVQWNRDKFKVANKLNFGKTIGMSNKKHKTQMTGNAQLQRMIKQMATMVHDVFDTFNADLLCSEVRSQSTLMRMVTALKRHRREQKYDLRIVDSIDFMSICAFWKTHMSRMSEWFMFCREFTTIPIEEKMTLFKNSCVAWHRLERLQMSVEIFGKNSLKDRLIVLSDEHAANVQKMTVDLSSISNHDYEYFRGIFNPIFERVFSEVLCPILEMQLSDVELTYLLCQLAFHVEGLSLSERTQQISTLFRNRISDDLHDYYTNTMNQSNYADRLIRLMSIIPAMENIQKEKAKVMELAQIFDVIKVNDID